MITLKKKKCTKGNKFLVLTEKKEEITSKLWVKMEQLIIYTLHLREDFFQCLFRIVFILWNLLKISVF